MKKITLLLIFLCLGACATKQQPGPECPALYVLLPDNYIIDLAAGSDVVLNPASQEFVLFCTKNEAAEALSNHTPPLPGTWRIYRLAGTSSEIAMPRGDGSFILTEPAEIADWEEG